MARALVGKWHQEGEQKINPERAEQGWRGWPSPQAPLRSVAEQLEILAGFSKQEGLQEKKKTVSCAVT